jgi:NTP pyrophosphatase (non-canonical NTP hydrolase)
MNFNEYQKEAIKTSIYKDNQQAWVCSVLGLTGEAGEVSDKFKKVLRDNNGELDVDSTKAIVMELGDVLWYLSNIASLMGIGLDTIASMNLDKLKSRYNRGKINGEGDNR